jgi:hypothetical protein
MGKSASAVGAAFALSAWFTGCFPPVDATGSSDTAIEETASSDAALGDTDETRDTAAPRDTSVVDSAMVDAANADTVADTSTLDTTVAPDIASDTSEVDTQVADNLQACDPGCEHGGRCVSGTCDCSGTGYSGATCGAPVCTSACQHGGSCVEPDVCDCAGTGYSGPTCEALESTCPTSTHSCVPVVPDPWVGPVALVPDAGGCGAPWPAALGSLYGGLSVGAVTCSCSCGNPVVQCPATVAVRAFGDYGCTGTYSGDPTASAGACWAADGVYQNSLSIELAGPSVACGPGNVTAEIAAPSWASTLAVCGGAVAGGTCADGTEAMCLPRLVLAFENATVCAVAPGDRPCPVGYPNKALLYSDLTDDRECPGSCPCEGDGAACVVEVERWAGPGCSGSFKPSASVSSSTGAACVADGVVASAIRPGVPTVGSSGVCAPAAVTLPSGGVETSGLHTACCR